MSKIKECRVLLVEDEALIRILIKKRFSELNCEIIGETGYGEDAVDIVRSKNPDLICMDIKLMGDLNGFEAAKIISEFSDAVIIFMSAIASLDFDEEIKKLNMKNQIYFLEKPISRDHIEKILKNL